MRVVSPAPEGARSSCHGGGGWGEAQQLQWLSLVSGLSDWVMPPTGSLVQDGQAGACGPYLLIQRTFALS